MCDKLPIFALKYNIERLMIKNILVSVFALFVAFAMPSSAMANPGIEIVETDFQQISISYANSILRVTGAEGDERQSGR